MHKRDSFLTNLLLTKSVGISPSYQRLNKCFLFFLLRYYYFRQNVNSPSNLLVIIYIDVFAMVNASLQDLSDKVYLMKYGSQLAELLAIEC